MSQKPIENHRNQDLLKPQKREPSLFMIRIEDLSKSYGIKRILRSQSYHFPEGEKIALTGSNGAGKTTLLRILCGIEHADDGEVLKPKECQVAYLPQEPNPHPQKTVVEECESAHLPIQSAERRLSETLELLEKDHSAENLANYEKAESLYRHHGGYELRAHSEKILKGLGFTDEHLALSPLKLSGGWRMRIELAKLLLVNPNVLILDEPTNHLDLPSLVWVEKYLRSFKGTLIFVSHDESLLNRLATVTVNLAGGRLTASPGNYKRFLLRQEEAIATASKTRVNLEKRVQELQDFVDRFGSKATKAASAQSKAKQIEKIKTEIESLPEFEAQRSIRFRLPPPPPCNRIAYAIKKGKIGYPEKTLCAGISLDIEHGDKVAIIGANGIGKSTLLKTMRGLISSLEGDFSLAPKAVVAHFAQDQLESLDMDLDILTNIRQHSTLGDGELRSILGGFLFHGDDVYKPVKVLSGGEKSRVGLACVLAQKANFLLLDEPTNHLDMASIDCLSKALKEFRGTICFVSHNRQFIDEICTHVFAMTPTGDHMMFNGNIDDYQRLALQNNFPNILDTETPKTAKAEGKKTKKHRSQNTTKTEYRKLVRRRNELEKILENLRDSLKSSEKELLKHSGDHLKLRDATTHHEALQQKIEALEDEWLTVESSIEAQEPDQERL